MPHVAKAPYVSETDYLTGELLSDIKHEYINGGVYAMSGAKAAHNRIASNVNRHFGNHLSGQTCESFSSDMKVKTDSTYFYPDVLVECSGLDDDASFTEAPTLIVEVLSRSTRKLDKTLKLNTYLQIPTVYEYVMIEQDFVEIEILRKSEHWKTRHYYLGDEIHFESIDLTLTVEAIYERVKNPDMLEWLEQQAQTNKNEKP